MVAPDASASSSARRCPVSPARLAIRRFGALIARARGDEGGATAIEFAMVALPFFILILGIIEIGLMFFAGRVLDNATAESARLIRTGQAYSQNFDAAAFKARVMGNLPGFFSSDRLSVDVRTYTSFGGISAPSPIDDEELKDEDFKYVRAGPSQIVVVRVFYRWPLVGSYLGVSSADLADGSRLLGSVQAFRTEPFPTSSNSGGST